ncbi:MAG TPA: hypothetical protein VJ866_15320, partial [Pyrinomonadaceae bacterium]|nr:hypothetical protein [Pyrinomonadaceae bacterium]
MSRLTSLRVETAAALPTSIPTSETVAVGVFSDEPRVGAADKLGAHLRELCERVAASGEFRGEEETTLTLHAAGGGSGGGGADAGGGGAVH